MKAKTVIGLSTAVGAASYLTYKKISEEIFNKVFYTERIEHQLDKRISDWLNNSNALKVKVDSFDGLKLYAYNVNNHDNNNYVIMVHGIKSNKNYMATRAYEFDKLGYNTLIIDQRSCGESDGKYHTYGLKESLDLTIWIDYLISKNPNVNICLYGVSMGAATIMMSLANKLPENVKCVIEDCGYSTLKDEIDYVIRRDYKLQHTEIILKYIEKKMKDTFGFTYDDVSIKNVLDTNEIPIMFIHGMDDNLVPYDMSKILYNHNKGYKKFYPVPNKKHTRAIEDPNYFNHLDEFIKKFFV